MPIAPGRCAPGRTLSVRAALGRLAGARRSLLQPPSPAHPGGCRVGTAGSGGAGRMEIVAWLGKRQTLSAALLLILALHLCFFPFIWGNQTLLGASRDVPSVMPNGAYGNGSRGLALSRGNDMGASGWLLEPDAALVHHQYFRERRLPLWNPYLSYSAPLAANMQSQPFNPLFILLRSEERRV